MNELAHFPGFDDDLRELALFAGAGGGILGGKLLGWRTVCAVEWEPYPAAVLAQRQNDGILPPFPIWDDVRTFDGRPWRGLVDVVSGGFPCQDISAAGRGGGIAGERSGLWKEFARIIGEVRPRFVFVENSPMLTLRGLDVVLGDLAALGFDAQWGVLGADDAGAPHIRKRIWIVGKPCGSGFGGQSRRGAGAESSDGHIGMEKVALADAWLGEGEQRHDADQIGRWASEAEQAGMGSGGYDLSHSQVQGLEKSGRQSEYAGSEHVCSWWDADPADLPDANSSDEQRRKRALQMGREWSKEEDELALAFGRSQWGVESRVGRVAHGVAARVDRLKAIGNGQVPAVVRLAWSNLK